MQKSHSINSRAAVALTDLLEIMASLRNKKSGCAWDLKQSLRSLTSHTLEEVYEVIDAVERENSAHLKDELGDLLFQIVFYARIAEEDGLFDFAGVAEAISEKLLRRHPHIFPQGTLESFGTSNPVSAISAEQVEINWEVIKQKERAARGDEEHAPGAASILDDVPLNFPALDRAKKLQKRAASVGFDWPDIEPVLAKLQEESAELRAAIAAEKHEAISHEIGDLLFTCVNLARHLRVEPESALRAANGRFERRFRYIEDQVQRQGRKLGETEVGVLEEFWNKAKEDGL